MTSEREFKVITVTKEMYDRAVERANGLMSVGDNQFNLIKEHGSYEEKLGGCVGEEGVEEYLKIKEINYFCDKPVGYSDKFDFNINGRIVSHKNMRVSAKPRKNYNSWVFYESFQRDKIKKFDFYSFSHWNFNDLPYGVVYILGICLKDEFESKSVLYEKGDEIPWLYQGGVYKNVAKSYMINISDLWDFDLLFK